MYLESVLTFFCKCYLLHLNIELTTRNYNWENNNNWDSNNDGKSNNDGYDYTEEEEKPGVWKWFLAGGIILGLFVGICKVAKSKLRGKYVY